MGYCSAIKNSNDKNKIIFIFENLDKSQNVCWVKEAGQKRVHVTYSLISILGNANLPIVTEWHVAAWDLEEWSRLGGCDYKRSEKILVII